MKINLAQSAGFCFGVKRAIDIAFETIESGEEVHMLGDIVHNEEVVKQIKKAGVRKIKTLRQGKDKIFLMRAHGTPLNIAALAQRRHYKIVDATCPMVKEIHRIAAQMEKNGYQIIVIGDENHDEVHGIIGQLEKPAVVIDEKARIPFKKLERIKKGCIVVQSTQNLQKVLKIVGALKPRLKKLKFFNTVCRPTRLKQEEIRKMPGENEVMIIIGSKTSANTKRLFEISKSLNDNSFWVQSKKDIRSRWFKNARSVGVTAGASTPDWTINEIITAIKHRTNNLKRLNNGDD